MYKDEQETIVRFDETQAPAEVYTASPRVYKFLTRYGLKPHRTDKDRQGKEIAWYYTLDKRAVCLKPANRLLRIGRIRTENSHSKPASVGKS